MFASNVSDSIDMYLVRVDDGFEPRTMTYDAIHPNGDGESYLASRVFAPLAHLLWRGAGGELVSPYCAPLDGNRGLAFSRASDDGVPSTMFESAPSSQSLPPPSTRHHHLGADRGTPKTQAALAEVAATADAHFYVAFLACCAIVAAVASRLLPVRGGSRGAR